MRHSITSARIRPKQKHVDGEVNNKQGSFVSKFTAVVATFLIAHSAQAFEQEVTMVEVETTPMAQPAVAAKADSRFENYALESFGCCGLQQPAEAAAPRPSPRLQLAPVQGPVKVRVVQLDAPLSTVHRVDRSLVKPAKREL